MSSLTHQIDTLLERSSEPDPQKLAKELLPLLSPDERDNILIWAVQERIRERIRSRRAKLTTLPRDGTRIIWPPDEELEALVAGDFTSASERLGVSRPTLKKYCLSRGIGDHLSELEGQLQAECFTEINRLCQAFGDNMRAEGIRIGLEQANTERVEIDGQWKLLGDCSAEDLRTLAKQYQMGASDLIQRGAFYLAIADRMEEESFSTVREMATADS